jgi:peroxiredoxin
LTFSFPDLNGQIVSQADARFQGKVVVINVTGSWCPNCHDEAPFLSDLYRRYRSLGLEVVALSFEEADQLQNPARLRAFIKRYGIEYTVLLAGVPEELSAKLPQAVNLNAFPTTFFVGRDGLVQRVQAGFASPASGEFHDRGKAEITALVEALLAERRRVS